MSRNCINIAFLFMVILLFGISSIMGELKTKNKLNPARAVGGRLQYLHVTESDVMAYVRASGGYIVRLNSNTTHSNDRGLNLLELISAVSNKTVDKARPLYLIGSMDNGATSYDIGSAIRKYWAGDIFVIDSSKHQ